MDNGSVEKSFQINQNNVDKTLAAQNVVLASVPRNNVDLIIPKLIKQENGRKIGTQILK